MKLCIIVNEYPPDRIAGTAVATQSIARYLRSKGVFVFVIVTERSTGSEKVSKDGDVHVFRLEHGTVPIFRWFKRIYNIRQIIKNIRPVVLHGQSISCGLYALIAGAGYKIPVLTSIQGNDLYESNRLQKITEIRWTLRCSDKVITVNRELAGMGKKLFGVPGIQVVHNGFNREDNIPDRETLRYKYGVGDDEIILVCVARLIASKGIDVLLRAVSDMKTTATLWLIGDGEERNNLIYMTKQLGIESGVKFLGSINHRSVAERMKAADLFVLPSRSEPFGISLLEAMDAGLPIAATEVGGIPEIVSGKNGILVPPDDSKAMSLAIDELLSDRERRAEISRLNLEKALKYRWGVVGKKYLEVYSGLIHGRH